MNSLRNRVQLIGNLGAEPEVRTFDNDRKMAKMRIATNDVYYNAKGDRIEDTQWHTLILWGRHADLAERFMHKGQEVAIEGKLVTRDWESKEGEKRTSTEVVVSDFVFLGKKEAA